MGWCHEFGLVVEPACDHPMTAAAASCGCDKCRCICTGKFGGCATVWDRGPLKIAPTVRRSDDDRVTDPLGSSSTATRGSAMPRTPRSSVPEADTAPTVDAELAALHLDLIDLGEQLKAQTEWIGELAQRLEVLPLLVRFGGSLPEHLSSELQHDIGALTTLREDVLGGIAEMRPTLAGPSTHTQIVASVRQREHILDRSPAVRDPQQHAGT